MKIDFNSLYDSPKSYDVVFGHVSLAKILYRSETQTYDVFSEIIKEYVEKSIPTEDEAKLCVKHHLLDIFDNIDIGEVKTKTEGCKELPKLLEAEIAIIKKHLGRHKYFKHISDENMATIDFAARYGFIMKEFYCVYVCKRKGECQHSKDLKSGSIEQNSHGFENVEDTDI